VSQAGTWNDTTILVAGATGHVGARRRRQVGVTGPRRGHNAPPRPRGKQALALCSFATVGTAKFACRQLRLGVAKRPKPTPKKKGSPQVSSYFKTAAIACRGVQASSPGWLRATRIRYKSPTFGGYVFSWSKLAALVARIVPSTEWPGAFNRDSNGCDIGNLSTRPATIKLWHAPHARMGDGT